MKRDRSRIALVSGSSAGTLLRVGVVDQRVRLAEVIGIFAMAADLGLGLPMEHGIRTCLLSLEMGRRVGLSTSELVDLYDVTLLRMIGCTAGSADAAEYFGDEVAFGRDTQHLDYGDFEAFGGWAMTSFGADRPATERERMVQKLFSYTPERRVAALTGHCEVAQMLATRLGFSGAVADGLAYVFERWDGTGAPNGVSGSDLPIAVRVMSLCNEVETHHRLHGRDGAVAMARQRSGSAFDPELVTAFCSDAEAVLATVEQASVWERLLAGEPGRPRFVDGRGLLEAGQVMGDFADLKSACFAGHSSGVATLAAAAAERASMPVEHSESLGFAALAHDLGRVTVSTSVWDKRGPLSEADWEAVRLHAYYSERMLGRAASLTAAAQMAGLHHERLDGSGYHRGNRAAAQPAGSRILAAADTYVAMRQTRPHRAALDPDAAAAALRSLAENDRLDATAVNAVLAAAGDPGPRVRRRRPADLSDREIEVLRSVAKGASIQEAASALHLAPKTVDFHLQNIYSKAGVSTRAAATMFAIQSGLLEP